MWSHDGTTVFFVDTPTQRIDPVDFDPDTGAFAGRGTVVNIPTKVGAPDGMIIDSEGGLGLALWGGGAVDLYTTEGQLDAVIAVSARQVTACAFGGDGFDDLFITTSRLDLTNGEQPAAGVVPPTSAGRRRQPSPGDREGEDDGVAHRPQLQGDAAARLVPRAVRETNVRPRRESDDW